MGPAKFGAEAEPGSRRNGDAGSSSVSALLASVRGDNPSTGKVLLLAEVGLRWLVFVVRINRVGRKNRSSGGGADGFN